MLAFPTSPTAKAMKAPARSETPQCIYQLHIALQELEPLIWRRIWVADNLTLAKLDRVIQTVMGWTNSHLHEFEIDGQRYGMVPDEFPVDNPAKLDRGFRLAEILGTTVQSFSYTYDFGDNWQHVVTVEELLKPDPEFNTWPICLGGQHACPPEDVGGIGGYIDFLEAMQDPEHDEHRAMWRWHGGPFDPYGFDMNAANRALQRLR